MNPPHPQDEMALPRQFLRMCRAAARRPKVADSAAFNLNGAQLLTRALILRRLLNRHVLGRDEQYVGLLVPPSVGGVLANASVAIDRRVAVNLNYAAGSEVVNDCAAQCGIRHVLTTRKLIERTGLKLDVEPVFLEELREKVTWRDKLAAAATWLLPVGVLERWLGLTRIEPEDVLTVIFTSGSTGRPKGVMLTHRNVGSNIEVFQEILRFRSDDVLVGVLPFFHSFGYTVTLWTALSLLPKGVYHYSPLEARQVGRLSREHGGTILIATPTFLRAYLRRCEPEDFAKLDVVIAGAEKLSADLIDAFDKKFGCRPVEGYGTTELSPVVSVNIPPSRTVPGQGETIREGSVGRPMPGISAKVVDLDTGEDLGPDKSGMLLIRGPNVMRGYLNMPEETAKVLRDGWYTTGDVARIDRDGFIHITGRLSRFSKIGGEMVPHLRVEEEIARVLDLGDDDAPSLAVTGVPDAKKGERLVVLHTGLPLTPEEICRKLAGSGLPPLWVPAPESFRQVDEIPLLASGKLDLRRVKEQALSEFGG